MCTIITVLAYRSSPSEIDLYSHYLTLITMLASDQVFGLASIESLLTLADANGQLDVALEALRCVAPEYQVEVRGIGRILPLGLQEVPSAT